MTWYDWIDNNFKVGLHDAVCGLPVDDRLADDEQYLRGRQEGDRFVDELGRPPGDDPEPETEPEMAWTT